MILDLLRSTTGTWAGYLYGAALCGILELLLPAERQSRWSWLRGRMFTFLSLPAAVAVTGVTRSVLDAMGAQPFFSWNLGETVHSSNPLVMAAGHTLVPMLGLFLYDINYHWFHPLQHTVPLLWRFHAIHHSIEELNAFNVYHHVSEYVWRIPLMTVPLSLLFAVSEPQVVIIGTILHAVGVLAHGNVRLNFGPLRYLLVEPRFHQSTTRSSGSNGIATTPFTSHAATKRRRRGWITPASLGTSEASCSRPSRPRRRVAISPSPRPPSRACRQAHAICRAG